MNNRSFSNRLSWRIIGIVSVVFVISILLVGEVTRRLIEGEITSVGDIALFATLIGLVGLLILFFVIRREIRRLTRPITELFCIGAKHGQRQLQSPVARNQEPRRNAKAA